MRLLVLLLMIIWTSGVAMAADIAATSAIDTVTVYPRGAEVKRLVKVKIGAGSHTVVIGDLPLDALGDTVRVTGKANGPLMIGAVDSRRLAVPSTDAETVASERRGIEDEIQRLRDERARITAEQQASEAQRTYLNQLVQLPSRPQPAGPGGGAREDWAQVLALIGREMGPVGKSILDAQVRTRDVDRRIKDAQGRLNALAPRAVQRTEVKVGVVAQAAVDAELLVSYQVRRAGWQPRYDARLVTGSKDAAPRMTVARRASIRQATSEPWERVQLFLSTARPSARSSAPELQPVTVDFPPERPPVPVSVAPQSREMSRQLRSAKPAGNEAKIADATPPAPVMEAAQSSSARVEAGTFQAVYEIAGRQTVPNANQAKGVQIDEIDFRDIQLKVRAVPRQDQRAYLYAALKVPMASPWLPGGVALFRDQTFIGNGHLPQLAPGQSHDLGFGADDRVKVEARSTEVSRGETGIISQSKTDLRNWRLVIKNLHAQPISFTVLDQMPVSNNQEIKVELIARPLPTKRNLDDKRGVLAWEDRLAAGEEKTVEFGYRVSWPAAKSIVYGR